MKATSLRGTGLALLLGAVSAAAPAQTPGAPAIRAGVPMTMNFVNTEIVDVSRAISAMLGRPIVVDPRVKGTITLTSERPMAVREAYQSYLAALRGLGFAVVESGGLIKVVPEAEAKLQSASVAVGAPRYSGEQIVTQVFRLNYENANNLVPVLLPLISPNNRINANNGNNTLVITDYADNVQRLARIIAALDTPAHTDVEVIPLRHTTASDMAALVQKLGDGGPNAPGAAPGAAGSGGLAVVADPRSNALIVRAANPARLAQLRAMVERLDQPALGDAASGPIRVVHLKNADAVKLAAVLRAAFGGSGSGSASPAPAPATTTAQSGATTLGGQQGSLISAAASTPLATAAQPTTGGGIQADPASNSLIITAAEPLYRQMRAVIDQLDGRRAQVYVEAMIVKLDVSKVGQFGVQWQQLFGQKGDGTISGLGTNFGSNYSNILNLSGAIASGRSGAAAALAGGVPGGLNIGFLKSLGSFYTLGALANFLESQTGANVLSTPTLVSLDNEEARIVIGQNVPFVTGSFTNTGASSGTINPFQTIDRKDVGLTLRIKSQIGEGGTVRMSVLQENSSVVPGATSSLGPTTEKSLVETNVVVDDGAVLVLGGLLKEEYTDSDDRVPGLGALPLVGHLFKSEGRKRIKTNLVIFLRPVILRDSAEADALTVSRYETIRALQQAQQPRPSLVLPQTDAPILPALPGSMPAQPPSSPASATTQPVR